MCLNKKNTSLELIIQYKGSLELPALDSIWNHKPLLPPSPSFLCQVPWWRMASSTSPTRHSNSESQQGVSPSTACLEEEQQGVEVKTSSSFINWVEPLNDLLLIIHNPRFFTATVTLGSSLKSEEVRQAMLTKNHDSERKALFRLRFVTKAKNLLEQSQVNYIWQQYDHFYSCFCSFVFLHILSIYQDTREVYTNEKGFIKLLTLWQLPLLSDILTSTNDGALCHINVKMETQAFSSHIYVQYLLLIFNIGLILNVNDWFF